jgi:hypothetical protein
MSYSQVEICNFALSKIGDYKIVSLDDESKEARACSLYYPLARDTVLRSHYWNCARARAELAAESSSPVFGYTYSFPLPVDCLRVMAMEEQRQHYEIEGRRILTNESSCKIIYIKKVTDTTEFDPLLVEVIALKLAALLAGTLTGSKSLTESLLKELEILLADARSVDAMEDNREIDIESSWTDARY